MDALVFTIARLAPPTPDLKGGQDLFRLDHDLVHDELAEQRSAMTPTGQAGFASRAQAEASRPLGGGTGSGLLALPQAFGPVYLGQSFAAIITATNCSNTTITVVGIKVEISTERGRAALLYDSTTQPLPQLAPGQRHDFSVRYDVKDLGSHSMACSASYGVREGERRLQGQHFHFTSLNPLIVRTKQRHVGSMVLLEATLENATRAPMLVDAIAFFPTPPYMAERIGGSGASASGAAPAAPQAAAAAAEADGEGGPLSTYIRTLPLIPEGGASAFLFRLTKPAAPGGASSSSPPTSSSTAPAAAADAPGAAALGRMEIRWRGPMGEAARLQTQQISLPPQAPREASLALARLPARIVVGQPFTATLAVTSHVADRRLGPLKLAAADGPATPGSSPAKPAGGGRRSGGGEPVAAGGREGSVHAAAAALPRAASASSTAGGAGMAAPAGSGSGGVCLDGPQAVVLDELAPRQAAELRLQLLALAAGPAALPPLALTNERDGRLYAVLPPVELFVESA